MNSLMTHIVAGYPSLIDSQQLVLDMAAIGVDYLEVQIPFSDPSADGSTIMKANDVALKNGTTIDDVFGLVRQVRDRKVDLPVYLMSYANKLHHQGISSFCKGAARAGASGCIVPDLPLGTPEYNELLSGCSQHELAYVPVVSPGMDQARLERYLDDAGSLVYVTTTRGITGNNLALDRGLQKVVAAIRASRPDVLIALGFGLRTVDDVSRALELADTAVVGSAVIDVVERHGSPKAIDFIEQLLGGSGRG